MLSAMKVDKTLDKQHAWGKQEKNRELWSENIKGRNHFRVIHIDHKDFRDMQCEDAGYQSN
jgi:hypothetical protein